MRQPEHDVLSNHTDESIFFGEENETGEETMDMSPDQAHALYKKTFAAILNATGLRSPQYYQDKSQCISFADIGPVDRACFKAANLKSGYIEPTDLIERLRKLKPSDNFELREYNHPPMCWERSPYCPEYPGDLTEHTPIWVFKKKCELSRLLGRDRAVPFEVWIDEHWKNIEISLNRTSLPNLHLLKNIGSSPNGTLYPRYLVLGLHSLRKLVEEKVSDIYNQNVVDADERRRAAILDWESRHPDVKLDHHLTRIFRTWPPDLMNTLDEIDRQTAWSGRRTYIDRLLEAEKQMEELVNFWKDCGLITGLRTPPSPAIRSLGSFAASPPQIGRESGRNQSPSGPMGSPPTQAGSSQFHANASALAHRARKKIKLSESRNRWDERLRPRTKAAKASCQTSRTDRHNSVHKSSTKFNPSEPRNIWDGRLRSSTKSAKVLCQTG